MKTAVKINLIDFLFIHRRFELVLKFGGDRKFGLKFLWFFRKEVRKIVNYQTIIYLLSVM
jgi:hypothetical protein